MDDQINVFREPLDETEGLGQRCTALEKQLWVPARQSVVEHVQNETDPEVLFHVIG